MNELVIDYGTNDECYSCGENDPLNECPNAERICGHHCNHIWTHDLCDWCGIVLEEE